MPSQRLLLVVLFVAGSFGGALACGSDSDTVATTGSATTTASSSGQGGAATATSATASSTSTTTSTGGGGGAGGAGGGAPSAVDTFCNDLATPFCEALLACCDDPPAAYGTTLPECLAEWQDECNMQFGDQMQPFLDAGESVLDPGKLSACAAKLQTMSAGGLACVEPPFATLQLECLAAFEGQVPAGQPCDPNLDFFSFVQCAAGTCQSGTCEAVLASGSPCTVNAAPYCNVAADEWCLPGPNGTECATRAAIGEACASPDQDDDISCFSLHCGVGGTCEAPTAQSVCQQG